MMERQAGIRLHRALWAQIRISVFILRMMGSHERVTSRRMMGSDVSEKITLGALW